MDIGLLKDFRTMGFRAGKHNITKQRGKVEGVASFKRGQNSFHTSQHAPRAINSSHHITFLTEFNLQLGKDW